MALPRPTSPLLRSLSMAGAVALVVGLSATSGHAAPATPTPSAPTTAADALTRMRTLYQQFATASEAFHEAETVLAKRTARSRAATGRARTAAKAVAPHRDRVKRLVKSESRSDPFGTFGAMLSSESPGDFAAQTSLIDVVATRRAAVLTEAAKASAAAAKAESEAKAAATAAAKLTSELRATRTELSRRAATAAALFQRLSMAERAALTAAQTPRAADRVVPRGSRSGSRTSAAPTSPAPAGPSAGPSPRPSTAPPAVVPVSGRAGAAVAEARRQLGKPYVWGATGPGSFDCSGLTSWSWRAAGVNIPRTSRQQYAAGNTVSRSALQPGDLVYFGSPIYHVAIYIGGNTMISAPQPGDVVKYQSLEAFSDYAGATRPG